MLAIHDIAAKQAVKGITRQGLLDRLYLAHWAYRKKQLVNELASELWGKVAYEDIERRVGRMVPLGGGTFSDSLEDDLLDEVLGGTDYTPLADVSIGLATAVTGLEAGQATSEVSTGGGTLYDRVEQTNNATNWPASSGGAKANGVAITFPTAGASWGTVTHCFIAEQDVPGVNDIIMWGALAVSKAIAADDTAEFAIGALDVTLD